MLCCPFPFELPKMGNMQDMAKFKVFMTVPEYEDLWTDPGPLHFWLYYKQCLRSVGRDKWQQNKIVQQ